MSHCTKKKLQKLNPSGNFSQFDPQKFVPANLKRWPIHKIKAHKNFMLHGIRWFFFHPFNWNVIWFPFNVSTLRTFSFLCKAVSLVVHFLPSYISFFFRQRKGDMNFRNYEHSSHIMKQNVAGWRKSKAKSMFPSELPGVCWKL